MNENSKNSTIEELLKLKDEMERVSRELLWENDNSFHERKKRKKMKH